MPDLASPKSAPNSIRAGWQHTHLGRLLGHAMRRFDERVLHLMAHDAEVPLALSNLAARGQVSAAHIHITRHLGAGGARLTELAREAGMSKQAMGKLVDHCAAWGIVTRDTDARDARARTVAFTAAGLLWLEAFHRAVQQAQAEFQREVGAEVATVVAIGLEAYAQGYDTGPETTGGQRSARHTPYRKAGAA